MPAAAVITIIGALLTVVVLAAYLISIALVLGRVNSKLSAVTDSLPVVAQKTEPVGSIIGDINNNLAGVDSALRSVLAKAR
ncbi:MAG TPA: hypothetical protein VFO16_24255 [Pseudonocardiaceae bacterium]|nr:hypothetical protein [Pseudonocardiaceae bacterium]